MSLNPIKTTAEITAAYRRYLSTTFPIIDQELRRQFEHLLAEPGKFVKGPILEATPIFKTGASMRELIAAGALSDGLLRLDGPHFPVDRPLYRHQELAIRKVSAEGRNLVVATGTGSGKTECFLIPVLDHLYRHVQQGTLGSGVRALIVYPMNALANDQLKRLRHLLLNAPEITFGRYTGETLEDHRQAIEHFRRNYPQEPIIENELLSREVMRSRPPHILLTNYAMLEYLLLRPSDCTFFDGLYARDWRYIILDEAHTYDGAKGIEVAMLLRRLKDRVTRNQIERLQCIATSATVGKDVSVMPAVVKFATELFSEPFEWLDGDGARQDVITSELSEYPGEREPWGRPKAELYPALLSILDDNPNVAIHSMANLCSVHAVPKEVSEAAARAAMSRASVAQAFVHELLKGDSNLHELRRRLTARCESVRSLAIQLLPECLPDDAERKLTALVELASRAKLDEDGTGLLSARYHLFIRALEGAYVALKPEKKLFLDRKRRLLSAGREYPVFEVGTCRRCGNLYLVGRLLEDDYGQYFVQHTTLSEHDQRGTAFLLLKSADRQILVDEDEAVAFASDTPDSGEQMYLCGGCAAVSGAFGSRAKCSCPDDEVSTIRVTHVPSQEGNVRMCPACGTRGPNIVYRFVTGQDAPVSVITTSLYQCLPEPNRDNASTESRDDEWFQSETKQAHSERQLLLFSDSRQEAAFFACYLNRTYSQILRRRLILGTVDKHLHDIQRMGWRITDFVEPLRKQAAERGLFDAKDSKQEQMCKVWRWLLLELMAFDRRNSLEGLGLLGFRLAKPERWRSPAPLLRAPWNLNDDEVWALFQVLLDSLRLQGAITFPEYVSPTDPEFEPRNREFFFRREGSEPKLGIFSWLSSRKGSLNRRRDFILKLAGRVEGPGATPEECDQLLADIWDRALMKEASPLQPYLRRDQLSGQGVVHQLRTDYWEFAVGQSHQSEAWFSCDTCTALTLHNVKGTCPTFRCEGTLIPCSPDDLLSDNHYRYIYRSLNPVPLRAEEHTAQLTNTAASELQDRFLRREVNVLSCSTTFELGVDVGELQAVLMRNMPPSTANYIQRAGRAGRRKESTAFVTTFAQRRSHDLTYFQQPEAMVTGTIKPPSFEIRNEKIVRRHVHAVALAAFWRKHPEYFGSVDKFFFSKSPTSPNGPQLFQEFLAGRPAHVQASLDRIVPKELTKSLGLSSWGWVEGLFDESSGVLRRAESEIQTDVQVLEDFWSRLVAERRSSDWVLRMINTMKMRQILDALSSHNVIPKYGFPVDVVELQLMNPSEEARRLVLERDLRIALSEYAPGGEVVAGGRLWTSTRVKKLPNREWPRYEYAICQRCRRYQRVIYGAELPTRCRACDQPLDGKGARRPFIVPEFGFVSEAPPRTPADSRPDRTYTTSVFFSGEASAEELKLSLRLSKVTLEASAAPEGRLAIVNRAGFKICHSCGYSVLSTDKVNAHTSLSGKSCSGALRFSDLGHEFKTDVLDMRITGFVPRNYAFWLSLLYALLEGASETLYISRDDLHGCLYPYSSNPDVQAMILFDDVPGGAGHVRRLLQTEDTLRQLLMNTLNRVKGDCGCDHDTSCYGCLRNYKNQPHHDELERGLVLDFLSDQLGCRP
jgi:ATP-dependent helicase YprA (DUF1998 family)